MEVVEEHAAALLIRRGADRSVERVVHRHRAVGGVVDVNPLLGRRNDAGQVVAKRGEGNPPEDRRRVLPRFASPPPVPQDTLATTSQLSDKIPAEKLRIDRPLCVPWASANGRQHKVHYVTERLARLRMASAWCRWRREHRSDSEEREADVNAVVRGRETVA